MASLFSSPKAPPPPPAIKPVTPMPVQDQAAIDAAKKKKLAELATTSGRASTILSDNNDTLGA